MRRDQRSIALLGRDVLGKLQMHRSGPLLASHAEGIAHHCRDRRGRNDLARHFRQWPHGPDDVDNLKACLPRALDCLLAGDHQHRHGAELRISGGGREIQRARSQGRQTHARPAGETAVGRGHECRRLLVAGQHKLDFRGAERLEQIEVLLSGQAEDAIDAFILQCRDKEIGALGHCSTPCFARSERTSPWSPGVDTPGVVCVNDVTRSQDHDDRNQARL